MRRAFLVLAAIVGLAATQPGAARSATASGDACVDSFNCYRLAMVFRNPFSRNTKIHTDTDTRSYGLQPGERHNCAAAGDTAVYGNRSAWYRLDAGVDGTVSLSADAAGYPILLLDYYSPHRDPIDYTSSNDLRALDCSAASNSVSLAPQSVFAGKPFFVQILSYCGQVAAGAPDPCGSATAGGPVRLRLDFRPKGAALARFVLTQFVASGRRVLRLDLARVARGATVRVLCDRGCGRPHTLLTRVAHRAGALALKIPRRAHLRLGATVTIQETAPGKLGRYISRRLEGTAKARSGCLDRARRPVSCP